MTLRSALALVVVLAASFGAAYPALRGGPVYDDLHMQGNRFMSRASDIGAVFGRNSADYLTPRSDVEADESRPFTYRPLAMLTLVATEATTGSMLWHHAVSATILALGILALVLALTELGLDPLVAVAVGAFVAANPAVGETWIFVNGRADLQAFACAAGFAWSLARLRSGRRPRSSAALAFVFALCAALSKETALATLGFVTLVVLASKSPNMRGRARVAEVAFVSVAVALGALLVGRSLSASHFEGADGVSASFHPLAMLTKVPRVTALALGSVVNPESRVMASLAFELSRPASQLEALGGVVFVGIAALAYARRSVAMGLAVFAIPVTLFPCVFVADSFWLGLDRYVALAILPFVLAVPDAFARTEKKAPDWLPMLASALLIASLAGLHATAGGYVSDEAFVDRMMTSRPLDPSGFVLRASRALRDRSGPDFDRVVRRIPDVVPYPPIAIAWFEMLALAEDTDAMLTGIERLVAAHPRDPQVLAISVDAALAKGDLEGAIRRGRAAARDRAACRHVVRAFERIQALTSIARTDRRTVADFLHEPWSRCR